MISSSPLVSVIIPCYNHESYIRECLLSVLNQSYKNIQLIVIDDGSTDRSVELIENLQKEYHFIFEAQKNTGISGALNKGITKYATGKYIAIVASDDFWHKDKIKTQIAFFEANQEYDFLFSNAEIVDSCSNILGSFDERRLKHNVSLEDIMMDRFGIPALTVIFSKRVIDEVGLFDENLTIEDWDMWLRISEKYKLGYIPKKLAFYRMHSNNISSKISLMMKNRFLILDKWKERTPKLYKQAYQYWQIEAFRELAISNKKEAIKYLMPYNLNFLNSKCRKTFKRFLLYGWFS